MAEKTFNINASDVKIEACSSYVVDLSFTAEESDLVEEIDEDEKLKTIDPEYAVNFYGTEELLQHMDIDEIKDFINSRES